jgi:hypothetical protein
MIDEAERELWRRLANGCSAHPSYKAKQETTMLCETCKRMRIARLSLKEKGLLNEKK